MGSMKKMAMAKKSGMKKAMGMKKMAMGVSVIAKGKRARVSVFKGSKVKTQSGLKKSDLKKNKSGKIVSAKASAASKKHYASSKASKWISAVKTARKALGIKGFCACGGKSKQGQALLAKARSFYKK